MFRLFVGVSSAGLLLLCAATAFAQVPDPFFSSATSRDPGPVSVMVQPDGGGTPLSSAISLVGGAVDATIEIYVLDSVGNPIPGIPAEDIWLETDGGGLVLCPTGTQADAPTDLSGFTTFSLSPAGGGHSEGELCYVVVQGVRIDSSPLDIQFNSPDIDGDGVVGPADDAIFQGDYLGSYHYRSDFNWDSVLNFLDLTTWLAANGAACPNFGVVTVDVVPDASDAPWQLDGPYSFFYSGQGDESLPDLQAGLYTITWLDAPCYGKPSPVQETLELFVDGEIIFVGNYTEYGTLNLLPTPPVDEAEWRIYGPAPFDSTFGHNQSLLACLPPGDYTVYWDAAPGWYHDCPGPQLQTLTEGGFLNFSCDFHEYSAIDLQLSCQGGGCTVPWVVNGPDGYYATGFDSSYLPNLVAGVYAVTLGPVPGHYTSCAESFILNVAEGVTEIVSCSYLLYSSLTLDFTPDLLDASWTVDGPAGSYIGSSDSTLSSLVAGNYTVTAEEFGCWTLSGTNPTNLVLGINDHPTLNIGYLQDGLVQIDAEPDSIDAPWHLMGPAAYDTTGTGDALLACRSSGDYSIEWQTVPGWFSPSPAVENLLLLEAGSINFVGQYGGAGDVFIRVLPDSLPVPWHLTGPASLDTMGIGSADLLMRPAGSYAIEWPDVFGYWDRRFPSQPETLYVPVSGSATFTAGYAPGPKIISVTDVGNDQGRNVRLIWSKSVYDNPSLSPTITGYAVYRQQGPYKGVPPKRLGETGKIDGWDYLLTVPARINDIYQTVVPTLCDSTDAGICWSSYLVSAVTDVPWVYYDSNQVSGYSIDNLSPAPPLKLAVDFGGGNNDLVWEPSPDTDVRSYRIYAAPMNGSECGALPTTPVAEVTNLEWSHSGGDRSTCYYLRAVDHAGNEGDPTEWSDATLTGTISQLPRAFVLHPPVPNPFNPRTTLSFELTKPGRAELRIYNATGRLVRTLLNEPSLNAGRHDKVWTGRDDSGRTVAAGVYFVQLKTGEGEQRRRVVLLK